MDRIAQKTGIKTRLLLGIALAVAVVFGGVSANAVASEDQQASALRGGRLYDNWYLENNKRAPVSSNPAYPSDGGLAGQSAQTWRCVACHGWDGDGKDGAFSKDSEYYTGIKGIRGMAGGDPAKVVAVLRDEHPGYSDLLDEADLLDLASFVTRGQIEIAQFIDRKTGLSRGNRRQHAAFYETVCVNCHGSDGSEMRQTMPLGRFARESPYETLHKIVFGHPGAKMPASILFGADMVADLVAYLQALPEEEILASIVRGGRLYDNWYSETGRTPPKGIHPSYVPAMALTNTQQANTWRCKECHGWDYMGQNGGAKLNGVKGIRASVGAPTAAIIATMKDAKHRFGGQMNPRELLDLANFVSKGQVNMDQYIDRKTGAVRGDPARYKSYYAATCSRCHGDDGSKITNIPPIGQMARTDPWSALHKVLNGHPDEVMTPMRSFDTQVSADIVALLQTLAAK